MSEDWDDRDTEFPAVVKFDKSGQSVTGLYRGSEKVPSQKSKTGFMVSQVLAYHSCEGAAFEKQGEIIKVAKGDFISLAGQRLERALRSEDIGLMVKITYLGREEKGKGGNNPAHLFKVQVAKKLAVTA